MCEVLDVKYKNIEKAGEIIRNGGLVAFPTETVYGLGGDVFNPKAIAKIFEAKERPFFDPLICHIADKEFVNKIAVLENEKAKKLIDKLWPGPLTIILPKKDIVPDIITSGLDTVAIRMPDNLIALEIIRKSNGAIAAPSANPFGYLSPTTAQHVKEALGGKIDLIIDGGACSVGLESTIIDMTQERPAILRPGGMTKEAIEAVIGEVDEFNRKVVDPKSPGQLPSHYAPSKALFIYSTEELNEMKDIPENVGLLSFQFVRPGYKNLEILSPYGNMIEAASNLFDKLHKLDKSGVEIIYAESVPKEGIGKAIMDRLYKASKK